MISPFLVGGFVETDRALLYVYAPYWFKGQGVIVGPPLKLKVFQPVAVHIPTKTSVSVLWDTLFI